MVGVPHGEGVAGAGAGVAVQLPVLGAAGAQAAGGAVRGGGGGAEVAEVRGLARHGAEVPRSRGPEVATTHSSVHRLLLSAA